MSAEIEEMYLNGARIQQLQQLVRVPEALWTEHFDARGLRQARWKDPEAIIAQSLERAYEDGTLDKLTSDQALKLIENQERKSGKLRDTSNDRPPIVVLAGVPLPSALLPEAVRQIQNPTVTISAEEVTGPVMVPGLPPEGNQGGSNEADESPKEEP